RIGYRLFMSLRKACRILCSAAVLSVGLLAMSLPSHDAHAELAACRSDPVMLLSNGMALDLSATIDDTSADVQQVTYIVYAPVGTRVTAVIHTSGLLGPKETLQYYPDNPAHDYAVATVVTTMTPNTGVTATT